MEDNLTLVSRVFDYIESHLEDNLELSVIARDSGYSMYHLHRIFTGVSGFSVHAFIQRRRLTEAARKLVLTTEPLIEIGIAAGYDTQQSFTVAFKAMMKCSPLGYRKKGVFTPLQLPFQCDGLQRLRGDLPVEVKIIDYPIRKLIGYKADTTHGFFVIGHSFRKLHKHKKHISSVMNEKLTLGLNDYSFNLPWTKKQPGFVFYAAQEVSSSQTIPKGMAYKELEAGRFVVFSFLGRAEDSLEPVADYVYRHWFPQSSCRFNEKAMYDLAVYHEDKDEKGCSVIEFWVPIL